MSTYSLHKFKSKEDITFSIQDYSKLKHGSAIVAKEFGYELAEGFFKEYSNIILTNQIVVLESAYAFVKNAASLMTDHFVDRLNVLIAESNGMKCERLKINRTVPYISDYGKLDMKMRAELLKQDRFTFDHNYASGKFLIFIDDVIITGTHQLKIEEMLQFYGIDPKRKAIGIYYAELLYTEDTNPDIESYLNTNHISDLFSLSTIFNFEHDVIVRPLKLILGWADVKELTQFFNDQTTDCLEKMYLKCIGEGYYRNPAYSRNFSILQSRVKANKV